MADEPAPDLDRLREHLEEGDATVTLRDTPVGKKLGFKTATGEDYEATPEEIATIRKAIDRHEALVIAIHDATEEHNGVERLWHAGQAIIDHYAANGYDEPEYALLAALTPFLNAGEAWFRDAVCLADLFDDPDALPKAHSEDAARLAGKTCRETGEADAVRAELRD